MEVIKKRQTKAALAERSIRHEGHRIWSQCPADDASGSIRVNLITPHALPLAAEGPMMDGRETSSLDVVCRGELS